MFYYCHNRWNFKYILDVIKGVITKTSLYHIEGVFFKTWNIINFFFTHTKEYLKIHVCSSFNTRKFFFSQFMKWPFSCQTFSFQSFTMQRQTGGVEAIDMKCSSCIQQKICVPLFHPPFLVCLIFFNCFLNGTVYLCSAFWSKTSQLLLIVFLHAMQLYKWTCL